MALFVFIYAEKGFHTHDKNIPLIAKNAATISLNNNICPICDFQVAGNTDLPVIESIEAEFVFLHTTHDPFVVFCRSLSIESFSGRGPPFSI